MKITNRLMALVAAIAATITLTPHLKAQTNDVIDLKHRAVTFTNLQGRIYAGVELVRADLDGITCYYSSGGGGRLQYSNLAPSLLESWSIPTNRIALSLERSEKARIAGVARQQSTTQATLAQLEALKLAAHKAGKSAGMGEGMLDGMGKQSIPTEEELNAMAENSLKGLKWDYVTGRRLKTPAPYSRAPQSVQAEYISGFRAGYEEAFKKHTRPAF